MNNAMMDLGPDSPALEGTTWWKPDGSDHFTIRDILMSPEGFSIRATDGRLINGDVMETYIQSEVPISIPKQAPVHKVNLNELDEVSQVESVKKNGNFGSLRYDHDVQFAEPPEQRHHVKDPINDPIGEPTQKQPQVDGVEQVMIDRVLGKVDMNDLVATNINPIESVDNGVVVLVNTLNIKRKEIRAYMANRVRMNVQKMIDQALDEYFDGLLGPDMDIEDIKTEDVVVEN